MFFRARPRNERLVVKMAAPATEHVRNVVLVGQDGAGKTSLAEAMLYVSGKTPRMGTTHDGKSYLDYDAEEIKRKFTIGTSIAPIPYKDYKINVLDTSGHPDFICDTLSTMQAAEMALFVVDAVAGPQVMTTKLWREAEGMRLSRAVFINHIDREHADFDMAMATLHARFGSRLGPVTIPIGQDADFKGVIDIIRMEARYFGEGDDPAEFADAAQAARDKLCDLVAEADDELMMKYLEGEEQLTQDELESLLDKAIAQELFIPVFVGSTIIKQGIQGLMEDICTYFPHPRSHGRFQMADGTSIPIDETNRPAAFAFKTLSDPFVGRLSFLKVLSGVLEPGMELINARTGKKERLGHLYVMMGKEATDVKSAKAGDIIVVPKLAETRTGDTISLTRRSTSSATRKRTRPCSPRWATRRSTCSFPAARSRRASMFASCRCASRIARPFARPPRLRVVIRSRRVAPGSSATAGCASPRTQGRATSLSTRSRAALSPAASFPRSTRACKRP